ncbi:VOC family protein [Sphingomonas sp. 2R-10]|nr:VOC family protein [Sphingomonas sp. 2R-10]MDJ0278642.1 VOC family protein [Sphingomonas sp. 2R-10]
MAGLHHVAIIASDYARSKAFYADVLGFAIVREIWRAERQSWKCDMTIPGAQIELFTFPAAPPRPSHPEALGLRHLAFTVADIDAEVTRLAAHGVACEPVRIDEHTGQRFTFFADPDGLPLELYETSRP